MTDVEKLIESLDRNSLDDEIRSYFEIGPDIYMNYAREKLREETGSNTSSARSYFIQVNDTLLPMKTIAIMAQIRKNVSTFNPNSITFAPALERLGFVIHHDSTAKIGKNANATTREGNERNYQWRLARPEQARFRQNVVNAPPAKAGGFGLRLEAGSVRHWADYTTSKSSSGSGGFWFLIYSFHTSSVTFPLVFTQ